MVVKVKSILFQNNLPTEYNTTGTGKFLPSYSPFKIKDCLYSIKQKLPPDYLIAKSTVFTVYLKVQQGPQMIIYNETDKHLKYTAQTSSKNTPDRPTGLF